MINKPVLKTDAQYLLNNIYDDINDLKSSVLDTDTIERLVTLADTGLTKDDVTNVQNNLHVECGYSEMPAKYLGTSVTFTFKKPFKTNKYAALAYFSCEDPIALWSGVIYTQHGSGGVSFLTTTSATMLMRLSGSMTCNSESLLRCSGICLTTDD